MDRVELPHLAVSSPAEIAVTSVSQIPAPCKLEATGGIEACRKLTGDCLVMNKAVCLRRTDGLFVKVHGVECAVFNPGNLRADECGAILEIFGAVLRPGLELTMVGSQGLQVLDAFRGACRITERSPCQRGIQMVFRQIEERRRVEQRFGIRCRCDRGRVITREEARLRLADPVPDLGQRQSSVTCQMVFEEAFIERLFVK